MSKRAYKLITAEDLLTTVDEETLRMATAHPEALRESANFAAEMVKLMQRLQAAIPKRTKDTTVIPALTAMIANHLVGRSSDPYAAADQVALMVREFIDHFKRRDDENRRAN
jgi:hypothetical protein